MIPVTWKTAEKSIQQICNRIDDDSVKVIVAVARGGLVPATMISHGIGCRKMHVIYAASYDDQTNGRSTLRINLAGILPHRFNRPDVLFVDDICDTGKTFKKLMQDFPDARYTSLYVKNGCGLLDKVIYSNRVADKVWVSFPWELQ
jgi:xanthine phosphoribosyltransferase